jgi:hypothetical protein
MSATHDPDLDSRAELFAPPFAQVVWKETTKVWVCRLSAKHTELCVPLQMHKPLFASGDAVGMQTPPANELVMRERD